MSKPLRTSLKAARLRAGLQQQELAARMGVSRQTLSAIESGETVPSTQIALGLARVLGCRVEDLFSLADGDAAIEAVLVPETPARPLGPKTRVMLATVAKRWVARRLDGEGMSGRAVAADGLVSRPRGQPPSDATTVRVLPLRELDAIARNLFVAGCDPALGLLATHVADRPRGPRLHWVPLASGDALAQLAADLVNVAGIHLIDAATGVFNLPAVQRRFPEQPMILVNLATWELGLLTSSRQGRAPRKIAELAAPGVRVVGRPATAGATELLAQSLAREDLSLRDLNVTAVAEGHHDVARLIAWGMADAGVATHAAAEAFGLSFVPLAETRFDLVLPAAIVSEPAVQLVLDVLSGARFRRELGALVGYSTAYTGDTATTVAA